VFSRIPIHKTPEVYRSCDILLKLSTVEGMFGPPLEMFHCGGTALVFDVTGHDEYIRAGKNAIVVQGRDTGRVVEEIRNLLLNREHLEALKSSAINTASCWPDWHQSSAQFGKWIGAILEGSATDRKALQESVQAAWQCYKENEKLRMKENPSIVWRYKINKLVLKFPARIQDSIKQLRTLAEVSFPPRQVS
jgi:O-antigen biosynthesis protein